MALKLIGVSLLALGLGPASSWAQSVCRANDAAVRDINPADLDVLVAQCTALLAIVDDLEGSDGRLEWPKTRPITEWEGITLTADKSRISRIEIGNDSPKLNGIVPDFSAFTELERLGLDRNALTGTIPDLSALTKLTVLDMRQNRLTGAIPDLSALTALETLDLGSNDLTGVIPDLSRLTKLEVLRFNDNRLTGSLPPLSRFPNLQHFNVARQNLTGRIPALTGLSKLERFNAEQNKLSGPIPSLTGLVEMNRFDVSDNALTGPIPDLSGLVKLAQLKLGNTDRRSRGVGNRLEGSIPDMEGLVALRELILSDNALTGPIPDLSDLTALTKLHLDNNRLGGPLPDPSASTNLVELLVHGNLLDDEVPDLSALTSLEKLHLASNGFVGAVVGLDSMTSLEELSLCFNGFDPAWMLPTATETRRMSDDLSVKGCLRIDEASAEGMEGESLTFTVRQSIWPVRSSSVASVVKYRTVDQTATSLDYDATRDASLTIPAMGADEFVKSVAITLVLHPDDDDEEFHETFLVDLLEIFPESSTTNTGNDSTLPKSASWTSTGTILGTGPPPDPGPGPVPPGPGPGPGPGPAPDPGPAPEPDPEPDPGPDPAACDRLVAPYWRGDGGIAVKPKNGRSAVFRHSCRGAQTTETLYANEAGLIVQLLSRDMCTDDAGKEIRTEVSVEGAEDGGWYWIDGATNSAVAPLLCEVQLGGSRATVPAGVSTDVTADATLFEHHASRLLGIVPHLQAPASGACSEYVAPYWKGTGGMVVSATDGESAQLTNTCGGVSKTQTLKANDAGLIVQLLGEDGSESSCTDGAGKVLRNDLSIAGVEPGGWYWLSGDRNSAVAPLACADHLGGSRATVPAGVDADATAAGTLFEHHVAKLIGIVPHLRRQE